MRILSAATICSPAVVLLVFAGCAGSQQAVPVTPHGSAAAPLTRASATETVLYRFGASGDGTSPFASLIDVNGTLYGTTVAGGGSGCGGGGCGTVYRMTTDGNESVVYAFSGYPNDGGGPRASLVDVKGKLYGTTVYGGANSDGIVFSVTKSGKERVLHSFTGMPDGASPYASLINVGGKLYGTTSEGGAYNYGTVFRITQSGREKVLYSFRGGSYGDGEAPKAGLIDVDGVLYGTTFGGGSGGGTAFKITLSGKERVLYRFATYRQDGFGPIASLAELNGTLYGTAWFGGKYGDGTVFSVTTSGKEKVLHSFKGPPDGISPETNLVNVNGTLYGTTWAGGVKYGESDEGVGTVFSVDASGKERVIYRFQPPPDGDLSAASLIDVNGTLFGTTAGGGGTYTVCPYDYGGFGCGTVFALTLSK